MGTNAQYLLREYLAEQCLSRVLFTGVMMDTETAVRKELILKDSYLISLQ